MSKQQSERLPEESDQQDDGSVYDFLYHDARRVGSFLAQLDPDGHLQSLKRTTVASRSQQQTTGAKGGVNFGIGQAALDGNNQASSISSHTSDKKYDPLWANARALLDLLSQKSLINRSIKEIPIGSLVVMSGFMKVMNVKLVGSLLANADVAKLLGFDFGAVLDANKIQGALMLQLMRLFPATVQCHFTATGEKPSVSWMALDESNMVISPNNLMLTYDPWLDGEWAVLGIKDADPDGGVEMDEIKEKMNGNIEQLAKDSHNTQLGYFSELLGPVARHLMGRPGAFYAVTPLLIFREVAANAK